MTNKAQDNQNDKEARFLRTVLIAVVAIPTIIWLLYTAYQKNQESGSRTKACEKKCTDKGHTGYDFKWPMFSGPQCTCIDSN